MVEYDNMFVRWIEPKKYLKLGSVEEQEEILTDSIFHDFLRPYLLKPRKKHRPTKNESNDVDHNPEQFLCEYYPENLRDMMPPRAFSYMKATSFTILDNKDKHIKFDPQASETTRTNDAIICPLKYNYGFNKIVHAYLDDYGYIDNLEDETGLPLNTQFKYRFMLDDYSSNTPIEDSESVD